jgi:uncharacterized protein YbjT (DUF2867 family)
MSAKRIIAITGATGAQGGGLARAILGDPSSAYAVRALVRDPQSPKAQALARLGAELVAADIDDEASLERGLKGAYGAFFVTFYWAHFNPEFEKAQAARMARAARSAGVQHVVWSTLEDTRRLVPLDDPRMPTLMGKYKVPHFDAKGESDAQFADQPSTLLFTSGYWENLIHFGMGPQRMPGGRLAVAFPTADKKIPWIGAEDIGKCAYGIYKNATWTLGAAIGVAGEHVTGAELASALTRALGERVDFHDISADAYRALGFPGADDLGNMFQYKRDFHTSYRALRDVNLARRLNPQLQDLAAWLAANARRIPVAQPEALPA